MMNAFIKNEIKAVEKVRIPNDVPEDGVILVDKQILLLTSCLHFLVEILSAGKSNNKIISDAKNIISIS